MRLPFVDTWSPSLDSSIYEYSLSLTRTFTYIRLHFMPRELDRPLVHSLIGAATARVPMPPELLTIYYGAVIKFNTYKQVYCNAVQCPVEVRFVCPFLPMSGPYRVVISLCLTC